MTSSQWFGDRLSRRGQAGLTLMEILLAMAIATILMAPLGAWAYGTLKSGIVSQDELGRANATGLLNIYFLRDVASARAYATASDGVADCTNVPAAQAGTPIVRLVQSGDVTTSVVYTVGSGADPVPIFRHVCAPDGTLSGSTKVLAKVQRSSVSARCLSAVEAPVANCAAADSARVSMTLRQLSDKGPRAPITVSGSRRTTGTGAGLAQSNPPLPSLKVDPGPRGYSNTTFTATSTSTDPDGDPVTVQWTVPANATDVVDSGTSISFRLPSSGELVLTASDGSNSAAGSVFIEVVNRPPVIAPDAACTLVAGTTFALTGSATDPDGDAMAVRWIDPAGAPIAGAQWTAPDGSVGSQTITLEASDSAGAVSRQPVTCYLVTPDDAGVGISPAPNLGGVVNSVTPGARLPVTFTALEPGQSTIGWKLFRKGADTPVNSASGSPTWVLEFTSAEEGEYEVVRITDGIDGDRVPFRINVEPSVTLTSTEQAGKVPARIVTFNSTAVDGSPGGSVVTTVWDFGDGSVIEAPAGSVVHTYTAPGTYTVTFRATDNDGAVGTVTQQIVVPTAEGAG